MHLFALDAMFINDLVASITLDGQKNDLKIKTF